MAVRFMDGCEHYPNTSEGILWKYDGQAQWHVRGTFAVPLGRLSDRCVGPTGSFGAFCSKQLEPSTEKYHVVAAAVQIENYTTSNEDQLLWARPGNPPTSSYTTWTLTVSDTGVLKLRTAGSKLTPTTAGDLRITTSSGVMTSAVYHFIEVEFFVDSSVGYIRLWVDGVNVGEVIGADTASWISDSTNPVDEFGMQQPTIWITRFDDIHILDSSGSNNTTRVGDTHVETIWPASDGNTVLFTPATGTNVSQVDEKEGDGDLSFVESGTVSAKDVFDMDGFVADTVFAVQPLALAKKTSPETIKGAVIADDTASDYTAIEQELQTDYKYIHGVFNEDPSDSLSWNSAKVNALEFGYKLTTKT